MTRRALRSAFVGGLVACASGCQTIFDIVVVDPYRNAFMGETRDEADDRHILAGYKDDGVTGSAAVGRFLAEHGRPPHLNWDAAQEWPCRSPHELEAAKQSWQSHQDKNRSERRELEHQIRQGTPPQL
jgi:hypothetical protein